MQTVNTTYNPLDKKIVESRFQIDHPDNAPYGGRMPHEPFRPAVQQENWTGLDFWQKQNLLDYPPTYRQYVTRGYGADTAHFLLMRNQPRQNSPTPIPIQQYQLSTQQIYVGTEYNYG